MMLAQMAHTHDSDSQRFHRSVSPALSAAPVVALLLVLDEIEQAAHFGTEWPCVSRTSVACLAVILAR